MESGGLFPVSQSDWLAAGQERGVKLPSSER